MTFPPAAAPQWVFLCCTNTFILKYGKNDPMTQVINMGVFPFLHYYVHWMRQDSCGVCCITNNFTSFQHKLKILREKIRTKRVHRQIQTHWVQDYRLSPLLVQTHTYKSVCSAWHFVHTHKLSGWQHGGCSIIASRVNNKQIRRTKNRHTVPHTQTHTWTHKLKLWLSYGHIDAPSIETAEVLASLPVELL